MSINVQNYVWSLDLAPTTKYVAIALADHAHDDGFEARPSQDYLARKTGLSIRHVRRCLRELLDLGVIRVERPAARGRCTVYSFPLPPGEIRRTVRPAIESNRRTSRSNRRTSTTEWADTYDPLIIKNPNYKEESDEYHDETRIIALQNIRKALGQASSR